MHTRTHVWMANHDRHDHWRHSSRYFPAQKHVAHVRMTVVDEKNKRDTSDLPPWSSIFLVWHLLHIWHIPVQIRLQRKEITTMLLLRGRFILYECAPRDWELSKGSTLRKLAVAVDAKFAKFATFCLVIQTCLWTGICKVSRLCHWY